MALSHLGLLAIHGDWHSEPSSTGRKQRPTAHNQRCVTWRTGTRRALHEGVQVGDHLCRKADGYEF